MGHVRGLAAEDAGEDRKGLARRLSSEGQSGTANGPAAPGKPARHYRIRIDRTFTLLDLMWAVIAFALVFRLVFVLGIQSLFLLGLVVPGLVLAYVVAMFARRATQQEALLWVLAVAAEKRMPLAPGIEAVADQYGGLLRRQAQALAAWLKAGILLPEALERLPGVLPIWSMTLVRVGADSGVLSAALHEAAEMRSARRGPKHPVIGKIAYLIGVLLLMQAIVAFLLIFVMPKFEVIFRDFGIRLPRATAILTAFSHAIAQSQLLPYLMLAEFIFLLCLLLQYLGWLPVRLPLVDRLARRRHAGLILRTLAIVVEGGQPLTPALKALSRYYPQRWVKRKLVKAHYATAEGTNWYDGLHAQRLVTAPECAVLASAERAGNLPWAMRELADSGERRLVYRLQVCSQLLFTFVVLSLGALVFFVAIAYFMPLLSLIEVMAQCI